VYAVTAPRAGTLRSLCARHSEAGGVGTVTYTIEVYTPGDVLVGSFSVDLSSNAIGQNSNLIDTIAVTQLDYIVCYESLVGVAGNVDAQISCEFAG
jgi:hypothetical protein